MEIHSNIGDIELSNVDIVHTESHFFFRSLSLFPLTVFLDNICNVVSIISKQNLIEID